MKNNQEFAVSSIKLMQKMWDDEKEDFVIKTNDVLLSFLSEHEPYKEDKVEIIENDKIIEIVYKKLKKTFLVRFIIWRKKYFRKGKLGIFF